MQPAAHRLIATALLLGLAACRPCAEPAALPGPRAPEPPSAAVAEAEQAWAEGRLPASVLEGEPRAGGEIVVQVFTDPPTLNTTLSGDWWSSRIVDHFVFQSLVNYDPYDDPDYRHVPELAESWEVTEGGRVYTFRLRDGVRWHDGRPFGARDVVATFDKIRDPATRSIDLRARYAELATYEAVDERTVRFTFERPYFMTLDVFADTPILPAHVIGGLTGAEYNEAATNPLNRHPLGTGPFRFVEWRTKERIVLERHEGYWGRKAWLERIVFRVVEDPTVARQLAEHGELDFWTRVLPSQWVDLDETGIHTRFHRSKMYDASYSWIGWNLKRPLFQDRRVRTALTLLTDRPGVISRLLHDLPRPTTCHFYWAGRDCPDLDPLPFDPARAVALLEEAGWTDSDGDGVRDQDGRPLRFTFVVPESGVNSLMTANKMKEDMRRAGIDLVVQKVEWSAYIKRLESHDFDACTLLWGGGPREDPTQVWHSASAEGGSNFIGYANPEVDRLIEQARATLDDDARQALFREVGRILHHDQPYTWLYVPARLQLVSKRIKGARPSLHYWQWDDLWVVDAPERAED